MAGLAMASPRVKSSWDTQQRLPYNPNAPRSPQKAKPITKTTTIETPLTLSASSSTSRKLNPSSVSELLKRKNLNPTPDLDETYMGYEIWMPVAPKVEKPRSIYNAASLAYIGDCIYELYARRHFLFPPLDIEEYNDRVMAVVRCEAQDMFLQKLLDDNFLVDEESEAAGNGLTLFLTMVTDNYVYCSSGHMEHAVMKWQEMNVLRWGKNVSSGKSTKTKKRAGVAIYNRASALETLVGYLYLTNMKRLDEVMQKLGFANGASTQSILEEENKKVGKLRLSVWLNSNFRFANI
ncbi:Ribonuclease III domain [Dillenia turbinata]|uniref:Ribonuclease III domain n=1 Tax=Dillenia turbinata TaxID=194707 RepID=A0AAN8YW58_9MAGN